MVENDCEKRAGRMDSIDPYRMALRAAVAEGGFEAEAKGYCESTLCVDSKDRGDWERMVEWLDERRQTYEIVF